MPASNLLSHLNKFGLTVKLSESLGGAALGLQLDKDRVGNLIFTRMNEIPEVHEKMSRHELFSACGKLVGHYPIAGWLRTTCNYMKRRADGIGWCVC